MSESETPQSQTAGGVVAFPSAAFPNQAGSGPARLVECWAHEASLVPPSTRQLMRHRMDRNRAETRVGWMNGIREEKPELVKAVYEEVATWN